MFITLDNNLKKEIYKVFASTNSIKNVYIFDRIPSKKLENAISAYASFIEKDERIIMLYDNTIFGSSREGFLLTTKRLYCKATLGKAAYTDIADIDDIQLLHSSSVKISVITKNGFLTIDTYTIPTGTEMQFYELLCETVGLLGGKMDSEAEASSSLHAGRTLICKGCGASNAGDADSCEYCGGSDFAEQIEASGATVAQEDTLYYK